jgi:mannose-6-phosphate isomerase-like protein (cupin superfamily)
MEIDGLRAAVRPGDAILIPAGAWHQITAESDFPLRFLCCCAPPYRHEDTYFA